MTNQIIRDKYQRLVNAATAEAREGRSIEHPGLQGKITEIVIEQLLSPLIPKYVSIGTGKLTDSLGNLSTEKDIILFVHDILPPMMFDEKMGLFPIESVLFTIEVKNRSSANNLSETIKKARKAKSDLEYSPGAYTELHEEKPFKMVMVAELYFAFGSDLTGNNQSELDRYRKYDPEADTNPAIEAICVVGQGYWWFNRIEQKWYQNMTTEENEEVVDFMAGIINSIPNLVSRKGHPRYGVYIVNPNPHEEK